MPRNLNRRGCHGPVTLEKKPHSITPEEAGLYYDEYKGMLVDKAHCPICGAKYLAWVDESTRVKTILFPRTAARDGVPFDLSYYSTFNDEPGPEDRPSAVISCSRA